MGNKEKKAHYYVERDLSWMFFNRRILQEAAKPSVPLLERLSYLGIYSNNIEELFGVRVASLKRIAEDKEKIMKGESEKEKKIIKEIKRMNTI